jgi:hypothetical protein
MKKIFFFGLFILYLKLNCCAQDFNGDVQRVMDHMMPHHGLSSYSMSIKYQNHFDEEASADSLHGEYKFSGSMYSIAMNGVESCQDD